jgi:hypothetical protein
MVNLLVFGILAFLIFQSVGSRMKPGADISALPAATVYRQLPGLGHLFCIRSRAKVLCASGSVFARTDSPNTKSFHPSAGEADRIPREASASDTIQAKPPSMRRFRASESGAGLGAGNETTLRNRGSSRDNSADTSVGAGY